MGPGYTASRAQGFLVARTICDGLGRELDLGIQDRSAAANFPARDKQTERKKLKTLFWAQSSSLPGRALFAPSPLVPQSWPLALACYLAFLSLAPSFYIPHCCSATTLASFQASTSPRSCVHLMKDSEAADEPPLPKSNLSWARISAHVSNLNLFGDTGGTDPDSTLNDSTSTSDRTRIESTTLSPTATQDDTISAHGGVRPQDADRTNKSKSAAQTSPAVAEKGDGEESTAIEKGQVASRQTFPQRYQTNHLVKLD